jgi:hypothetical protein
MKKKTKTILKWIGWVLWIIAIIIGIRAIFIALG